MIRCWWHRRVMARCLDDGAALPARVRRHLDGCASCRAIHERERQCAALLSGQAAGERVPAPPFLRQRVMANLESWEQGHPSRGASGWWTITASVAAVVVAFCVVVWHPDPAAETPQSMLPPDALAALQKLSSGVTVMELGARLDAPLQGEWDLMMSDARNALAALTRSFTPQSGGAER